MNVVATAQPRLLAHFLVLLLTLKCIDGHSQNVEDRTTEDLELIIINNRSESCEGHYFSKYNFFFKRDYINTISIFCQFYVEDGRHGRRNPAPVARLRIVLNSQFPMRPLMPQYLQIQNPKSVRISMSYQTSPFKTKGV